jgi:hypothetical protein
MAQRGQFLVAFDTQQQETAMRNPENPQGKVPAHACSMGDFVIRRNIERYRRRLEEEPDGNLRKLLHQLLTEEEAKLAEYLAGSAS